jgi:uncharacterized membrane protein YhaH (DUF805 family)
MLLASGEGKAMQPSFSEFLFSAKGRVSRSQFWLKWVLPYSIVTVALSWVLSMLLEPTASLVVTSVYLVVALWPSIAIYIKRSHDRGRSGWFILLLFVPILNIWALIEFLFLRGTLGANGYGSDPAAA